MLKKKKSLQKIRKKEIQITLLKETQGLFNGDLNNFIIKTQQQHEQIIDKINLDKINYAGWSKRTKDKTI